MKTLIKWTIEEYHKLINTGVLNQKNVEFIEGEIINMPPESPYHRYINEGISGYIRNVLKGLALVQEAHPITVENSEPEPDLAIIKLPRNRYRNHHPYPEDIFWLIEISNTTLDFDLNEKKRIYAQANIPEYWVVDIKNYQIYLFRNPNNHNYEIELIINQGKINTLAFPNIDILVSKFWE